MVDIDVAASLGPMAPLLRQIHSLPAMDPTYVLRQGNGDIKRLKEHLEVLSGDLLELEEHSSTPSMLKWWRKKVRELLYDTEDQLDEAILLQAGDLSGLVSAVEHACEIRKRLQLPSNKIIKTGLGKARVALPPRPTSLQLPMPMPVDAELVQRLAFNDQDQKQLKVVPIFGLPGVGKTTAASTLYHKHRGKFQCSAFVRVSRTPDTRSLLISIMSQIKAPRLCGLPDVHDLFYATKKHLEGKRYFIVMDDLWTASAWDIISRAFPNGDYGSRIITTTQIHDVALACCRYYPNYVEMSPLNDGQSKKLFFTRIFGSEEHCPSDLKEVSYTIVKKCADLPLAIVTVASLLARESNRAVEKWEDMQNSLPYILRTNPTSEGMDDSSSDAVTGSEGSQLASGTKIEKWKHKQGSLTSTVEGLKQVLSFIYNNLPPHLHTFLLYLSMYPEGYLVRKQDLVRQWVAEGFVTATKWRSAEEIAESYFDELISTGMVQPVVTKYGSEVLSCTVHHMVLDLIRHISKEMNFVITVDYMQSWLALPDKVRRLSLQFGGAKNADIPENILISKVRSLLFSGYFKCVPFFSKKKCVDSFVDYLLLRVLILHIWAYGKESSFDLTKVSELLRLRYLKIQCNMTVNLPDKISGLKHLETLEVDASLSAVPSDIGQLNKLLHLLLPSEAIQPQGLGIVAELTCLTNLQDLHLTFSTIPSESQLAFNMEDLGSILKRLNKLRYLTCHGAAISRQIICDDGLRSVSPSLPHLEKLELRPRICFLSRLPEWIGELSRLTILKIEVLDLFWDDIYILSRLPSLSAFSLAMLTEEAESVVFDRGFRELKYFKFVSTAPCMRCFQGAMLKVQKLKLAFNANRMTPYHRAEVHGFHHMSSLTEISVKFGGADADESNKGSAERIFRDAISNHPNSPIIFNTQWVDCVLAIKLREGTKGQDDIQEKCL